MEILRSFKGEQKNLVRFTPSSPISTVVSAAVLPAVRLPLHHIYQCRPGVKVGPSRL